MLIDDAWSALVDVGVGGMEGDEGRNEGRLHVYRQQIKLINHLLSFTTYKHTHTHAHVSPFTSP